jgi:hypothetical protein
MRRCVHALVMVLAVVLGACGSSAKQASAPAAARLAHWRTLAHVKRPLDVAGPRADGSLVLAKNGRLGRVLGSGAVVQFAGLYRSSGGEEPYIAIPAPRHRGCSFGRSVYALRLTSPHGVIAIAPSGRTRRLANINAKGLQSGIAFDETGRFGHRLLVTVTNGASDTTVLSIGCRGAVKTVATHGPRVEGGIAVAPRSFGRFGGDLIAPDEQTGRIYAFNPAGKSVLIATSDVAHGPDIGVEGEVFLPHRKHYDAVFADRLTPGNKHPGDDLLLALSRGVLLSAGARPGDLLIASEGGAKADAVSCGSSGCRVHHVADGPAIAHGEGHIAILPR